MEYQKNAFGETEQEERDFEILVLEIIGHLKGLTRQKIDRVLRHVNHFIEKTAILT